MQFLESGLELCITSSNLFRQNIFMGVLHLLDPLFFRMIERLYFIVIKVLLFVLFSLYMPARMLGRDNKNLFMIQLQPFTLCVVLSGELEPQLVGEEFWCE